jgi:hypothetical protein
MRESVVVCSRSLWAKVNFLLFDRCVYFESRIGRHTSTKSESSSDSPLSAQQSVTKCIGHSAASVSSCPTRFGGVDGGRRGEVTAAVLPRATSTWLPSNGQLRRWRFAGRLLISCRTILGFGSALGSSTRVCMVGI